MLSVSLESIPLRMKSRKVNQSKNALKKDGAIEVEPTENVNTFEDFSSDLSKNLNKVASHT